MKVVKLQVTKFGKILIGMAIIATSYIFLTVKLDNKEDMNKQIMSTDNRKEISAKNETLKSYKDNKVLSVKLAKDTFEKKSIKTSVAKLGLVVKSPSKNIIEITTNKKMEKENKQVSKKVVVSVAKAPKVKNKIITKNKPSISCNVGLKKSKKSKICTINGISSDKNTIIKITWLNLKTNKIERNIERKLERYTNSIYDYRFIAGRENVKYRLIFDINGVKYINNLQMN